MNGKEYEAKDPFMFLLLCVDASLHSALQCKRDKQLEDIIKSKILSAVSGLVHGVSTKAGGSAPFYNNLSRHVGDVESVVAQNRQRFFGSLGINESQTAHANQVHSAGVTIVTKPGLYTKTDALITNQNDLFLVISVADCLPVMIYDPKQNVTANIHSGWRGTQKNIVTNAINTMKSEFGSNPEDMIVFAGPGICKEHFEVGEEVAELFEKEYISRKDTGESHKLFVDIGEAVTDQIINAGVNPVNIERSEFCTYSRSDYLHSYRRDKNGSGRMFAVIGKQGQRTTSNYQLQ